ncbi:MAG: alpha-hydroxy-acid oxidizing protein [Chloroflexota bacterium]|nr:alpha-hydroxy-acid oxidizing protein [Chloroflexota bacterium]
MEAPDFSTILSLADFERVAAERMDRPAFGYIAGGAGDEISLRDNRAAFARWRMIPRVLNDVSAVDTALTLLGTRARMPVGLAPMAFHHFAHPDAELASVRGAARAGALFCLSTMSSRSMEEVAAAADAVAGGPRWFQLYVHRDRQRSVELVRRATAAGYSALIVTVDLPVAGKRERDVRNAFAYPQVFGNFPPPGAVPGGAEAPLAAVVGGFNDAALTWRDLDWLRGVSDMPLVVKGVLAGADAALAVEHGAAGVIVSNHGGRQLDRTPAPIDVLAEVVDAVAGRAEVYLDGGVRRGVDVLTALALGARAVFVGRPMLYALAVGGEAGVRHAFDLLATELATDMALLGASTPEKVGREHVRRQG